jgi:ubiquinone biosynthesis protein Coq4
MHRSSRRQLLHLAADRAALVENPSDLPHGFDLLTRSYATPAAEAARAALRHHPAIAPLVQERYWGSWPCAQELLALPPGSLGHSYASWFAAAGGQPLPEPVLEEGTGGDDIWLHQRVRHTHDLWHVVSGCPPTAAGEAALSAINVMQLRWPGSAMLLGADLLHRCWQGPTPGEPDVGEAVAYGLEVGRICAPLLAQRWEEGWGRPLVAWREQLGIASIVPRSPFRERTWLSPSRLSESGQN